MNLFKLAFFAQTAAQPQQATGALIMLPMYLIIFAVFYIFLIRPQKKKEAEHAQLLGQLKKNDQVITSGGIHGTVVNVKDSSIIIKIDDNVKVEFQKSSVSIVKKSRQSG